MKANGLRRQYQLAEFCSAQEIRNGESALWSGTMKIRDIFTVQSSTFSKNQKKCRSLYVFADADRRYAEMPYWKKNARSKVQRGHFCLQFVPPSAFYDTNYQHIIACCINNRSEFM